MKDNIGNINIRLVFSINLKYLNNYVMSAHNRLIAIIKDRIIDLRYGYWQKKRERKELSVIKKSGAKYERLILSDLFECKDQFNLIKTY